MINFKKVILFVTLLLFIYNAFFTYIIVQLTTGTGRFVFLILVSLDYIIIFYFVLSIATELRREKAQRESRVKGQRRRGSK